MQQSRRSLRIAAGAAVLTLSLVPVLTAGASAPGGATMVAVPAGVTAAAIPGAVAFGTTDPSTPETVSFVLKENNLGQLEQSVTHGVRNFLSVSQFAATYGQSTQTIGQLQSYLAGFGITTQVYPDDVVVVATGTAGAFDSALATHQREFHVPAIAANGSQQGVRAQTIHGNLTSPELPNRLASSVLAILGLTNYGPFTSNAVHASATLARAARPDALDPTSCEAIAGIPSGCNLPSDFAANYGLTRVAASADGSGQTIGVVTLAALNVGAPEYFWSTIANVATTGRTVSVDNVDGGPGAPSQAAGSTETDLDVEQSGALAPGANVVVYQAPNTDFGFADAFFTAASQNVASSVSASWGESETVIAASVASGVETPAYAAAFDEAFLELAAQGQSTFVSAGDSGAYDASADLGTTNLSVDSPASSPYVTVAGGTTLPWSATFSNGTISVPVQVASQRAWGWDYLFAPIAALEGVSEDQAAATLIAGGGGGFSATYATPSYQQGVSGTTTYHGVDYLQPTAVQNVDGILEPTSWNFDGTGPLVSGHATGRAVPDVSADADPETGYLEYSPSFGDTGGTLLQGGWGGTSFVAPQFNGVTAVLDAALGHRVGFWNPSIYGFATAHNSPFTPLQHVGSSNDNLFYTGNPGAVYNPSTGLGVANFSALARDFALSGQH